MYFLLVLRIRKKKGMKLFDDGEHNVHYEMVIIDYAIFLMSR